MAVINAVTVNAPLAADVKLIISKRLCEAAAAKWCSSVCAKIVLNANGSKPPAMLAVANAPTTLSSSTVNVTIGGCALSEKSGVRAVIVKETAAVAAACAAESITRTRKVVSPGAGAGVLSLTTKLKTFSASSYFSHFGSKSSSGEVSNSPPIVASAKLYGGTPDVKSKVSSAAD